jgi:photosystem II stability/assembly factor-like uncharacterized protein
VADNAAPRRPMRGPRPFAAAGVAVVLAIGVGVAVKVATSDVASRRNIAASHATTPDRVTSVSTTLPAETEGGDSGVGQELPQLAFVDEFRGWRAAPLVGGQAIEFTRNGGRSWVVQQRVPANNDDTNSVIGVVAVDLHHAFALAYAGNTPSGVPLPNFLLRTTDGVHWRRVAARGLPRPLRDFSFADPSNGWGITFGDDLVATADGGDHWHTLESPATTTLESVCLAAAGAGWVATTDSVYRSTNDGVQWRRQITLPYGGDLPAALVCRGSHVAYAAFSVGAGQHIGGFVRSDDGGVHWRSLTVDHRPGSASVDAAGFPDTQERGDPTAMTGDGTLVFVTGCYACSPQLNWVVVAGATDHFVVGHFDETTARFGLIDATAVNAHDLFAEVRQIDPSSAVGGTVSLYATVDGGHTWQLRDRDG